MTPKFPQPADSSKSSHACGLRGVRPPCVSCPSPTRRTAVIGGGIAGLAAAWEAAKRGEKIIIFERSRYLGGKWGSVELRVPKIVSPVSLADVAEKDAPLANRTLAAESSAARFPVLVDNGQHLLLKACSQTLSLLKEWQIDNLWERVNAFDFLFRDYPTWRFQSAPWGPGRLKFLPAFLKIRFLPFRERIRLARDVLALLASRSPSPRFRSFAEFLDARNVSDRTRQIFWNPIITSALGDLPSRAAFEAVRKTVAEGVLAQSGLEAWLPKRPLREIFHHALLPRFDERGIEIRLLTPAAELLWDTDAAGNRKFCGVRLASGETIPFDFGILAANRRESARLDPSIPTYPWTDGGMTAVHLWLDRRLLANVPAAVLSDGIGEWLFSPRNQRGRGLNGEGIYHQVLISGSHRYPRGEMRGEPLLRSVLGQLASLLPEAPQAHLFGWAITTVPDAIFLSTPEIYSQRPGPESAIPNLKYAGDWLATAWPACAEGAVRSVFRLANDHIVGP